MDWTWVKPVPSDAWHRCRISPEPDEPADLHQAETHRGIITPAPAARWEFTVCVCVNTTGLLFSPQRFISVIPSLLAVDLFSSLLAAGLFLPLLNLSHISIDSPQLQLSGVKVLLHHLTGEAQYMRMQDCRSSPMTYSLIMAGEDRGNRELM